MKIGQGRLDKTLLFILSCFFIALSLYSCASIPEPEHTRIIHDVPFYPQEAYQCGPASLAGVMNYRDVNITPDEIAKEIYSESARGTLNLDMVVYPQKKGLIAEQYSGSMNDLKKDIDTGHPLIVLVDYGFSILQENHFMVIVGYNKYGVIANSGKDKGKFISEKDFMRVWERTKFWTLRIRKQ